MSIAQKIKDSIFASRNGTIAQLVEQRTENPCVPGSIPGGTTKKEAVSKKRWPLFFMSLEPIMDQVEFRINPKIRWMNLILFVEHADYEPGLCLPL
jgi:hypothetical protein